MRWVIALVVVALCCVTGIASARPGGGETYSSGASDYSSSSSSGGGYSSVPDYSYSSGGGYSSSSSHDYTFDHSFDHDFPGQRSTSPSSSSGSGEIDPKFVMVVVIAFGLFILVGFILMTRDDNSFNFATYPYVPRSAATYSPVVPGSIYEPPPPPRRPQLDLSAVLAKDPDFSRIVFEDFAYQLYSAAQRSGLDQAELDKLTPYFSDAAREKLVGHRRRVDQVVIGSLGIRSVLADSGNKFIGVVVTIEANLAGAGGTTNVKERWTFLRDIGVKTRPPERTRTLACPNCNAPFIRGTDPRTCSHCNERISVGRFDWTVAAINVDAQTSVGYTLTGTVAEVGNDYSTVLDPNAWTNEAALRADDPSLTMAAFLLRAEMIYKRLNLAWNAQELEPVRGLVTASLLQYLQFWIDEYKRQRLANKLDEARISHIGLAKVTRDRWYDAITVRVHAAGFDFTLSEDANVVGGSRTDRRAYTEYWTFIRSSARRGAVTTDPKCPNCGAPLAISDTGACTSCNAEIENASFDWTLSKIEQDDVYRG